MAENTSPAIITMTCEVCSEYYTDPLMFPCLHSFCKKCLIKDKEKQGSADTSLKCLTCDTSVNLPDGKIEGLTQNLWFEHKSKEASIKKKIVSKETILCDKCDDSSDAAVVYCCDCGLFLCDYCKKGHKRNKKEANHNARRNSVEKQLDGFRKLVKQVSHGRHLASSVSERTDPGEVLSVKKLITNQLEECIEEYNKLPLEIEDKGAILTRLDTPSLSKEINEFGSVSGIDAYSIDSGLAIPLATVKKERKFKVALPAGIGKAASYLKGSFIKSNGRKDEGRVVIVNDNNTAIVSCTPQSIGRYELSVTIRGHHIKGSPYQLSVKASRDYTTLTNQRSFNVGSGTYGVAVHTNGEVFASSTDGFVQVFSEDGTAVRRIGSKGNGNGQFEWPRSLLLVRDRLYVSDDNLHRVQYFSATTGQYIGQFGGFGLGNGQFCGLRGMSTDGKGNILVADHSNKRVQVFKEDGTFVQVIQCDGNASDVAVDNEGKIHVTIWSQYHVQVFSPDGKTHLDTYNNPAGCFNHPNGIAIDNEGYTFVSSNNGYLNVLSPDRKQVKLISRLSFPWGGALDKDGYIYVAESGNKRIMKY
uniref:B box-type domain-containing protein n=1 Tax=Amphimedon queenslandica TaxID=400682 RepID=A0A1X7TA61_AMPQE